MRFLKYASVILSQRVSRNYLGNLERWKSGAKVTTILKVNTGVNIFSRFCSDQAGVTLDFDDELGENSEILQSLRTRHHYHSMLDQKEKTDHKVFVIEPDFKWGRHRFHKVSTEHRLDEACGLVEAIETWKVSGKVVEPVRKIDSRKFFGKGKIEELTETIKTLSHLDAVYVDVARLTARQHEELEDLWGLKVFDRFGIVLQIFKERAKTSEAKIQVELAEIPYLRSRLVRNDLVDYDQQRGGTNYIGGAGETQVEREKRVLLEREAKLKKKLEALKKHRVHVRHERQKKHVPIVSVVGYTNAGKTTLIKALTKEAKMQPEDKLFATLDVTAHPGKLPSGMTVLFIDTVGFISDLPPELVESFSVTLEDVTNSDVIIHVQDLSHPDAEAQKDDVLSVLKKLNLGNHLMENIIEVNNKVDLCSGETMKSLIQPESSKLSIAVSALYGTGLDKLCRAIEEGVINATGREVQKLIIPPDGPQLHWLYHEATVQHTTADKDGNLTVTVVMDESTKNKYKAKFGS